MSFSWCRFALNSELPQRSRGFPPAELPLPYPLGQSSRCPLPYCTFSRMEVNPQVPIRGAGAEEEGGAEWGAGR